MTHHAVLSTLPWAMLPASLVGVTGASFTSCSPYPLILLSCHEFADSFFSRCDVAQHRNKLALHAGCSVEYARALPHPYWSLPLLRQTITAPFLRHCRPIRVPPTTCTPLPETPVNASRLKSPLQMHSATSQSPVTNFLDLTRAGCLSPPKMHPLP